MVEPPLDGSDFFLNPHRYGLHSSSLMCRPELSSLPIGKGLFQFLPSTDVCNAGPYGVAQGPSRAYQQLHSVGLDYLVLPRGRKCL